MKYRKKPVIIEAIQFEDNTARIKELSEFMDAQDLVMDYHDPINPKLIIETLEDTMKATIGDYIIKGVHGEFYPCRPDIFEETYERVTEGENEWHCQG